MKIKQFKIETFGRISEGDQKGWYVFVRDDAENTGGYLILLSSSLDPHDSIGFDDWVENLESLQKYFLSKNWEIHWLDEKP